MQVILPGDVPRLVYAIVAGSHMYGFAGDSSDFDIRGCFVRPLQDYLKLSRSSDFIQRKYDSNDTDIDIVLYELEKEMRLIVDNNCNVYEHLFSAEPAVTSPEHVFLKELAKKLLSQKITNSYVGLAKHNYKKYIEPFVQNDINSIPAKKWLYVIRALMACDYVLTTGKIESNIMKLNECYGFAYIDDLIREKNEKVLEINQYKRKVNRDILDLFDSTLKSKENTRLPEDNSQNHDIADALYYYIRITSDE
jgi:hypothetical protein